MCTLQWRSPAGQEAERTCCSDAGEDPALAELDGRFSVPELLQDQHAALPFGRRCSAAVIVGPVAFQHASVVGRIHLHTHVVVIIIIIILPLLPLLLLLLLL